MTEATLVERIRKIVERGGLNATARAYKVSAPRLSEIVNGKRELQPGIAKAFGWRKVVTKVVRFERIEGK